MSDAAGERVAGDCSNLRQGDVVGLLEVRLVGVGGEWETVATPAGVAILSQTCDIVQPSKARCLVAPVVVNPTDAALSGARKGQKPLHLYLESQMAVPTRCIADMEQAVSTPKVTLAGAPLIARYVEHASGRAARAVAWRVGRAFSRFPFPGEVYPAFNRLRGKAQERAGSLGNFGRVLDLVQDLRVSADQWTRAGRNLILYVVVDQEHLIAPEDVDPNWYWDAARVKGLRAGEMEAGLSLDRVCELLLANLEGDRSSLAHLWRMLGDAIQSTLLAPALDREVVSFGVLVVSDAEMTYRQYQQTESLDLEVLSNSTDALN
ncbi:MAG: hypothetical protein BGO26_20725 [Actinobacteria bacterium 69-20]|nr:hypothetical protein [Actinomycetota bacterium]OJV24909.1 MAG: hypothetical protein BGO26_20725 [Actinobacteria bacterium 69-20]